MLKQLTHGNNTKHLHLHVLYEENKIQEDAKILTLAL